MEPSSRVKLPIVEPVSALRIPVVVRFSSPNEMAPPSSVIVPLSRVILPTEARDDALLSLIHI